MEFQIYEIPMKIKNAIYLLIDDDEIVYVGKTQNGLKRIVQHTNKKFNKFGFIEFDQNELDYYEDFYIMKYQPKYNDRYSCIRMSVNSSYNQLSVVIKREINIKQYISYLESNNIEILNFKNIPTITKQDYSLIKNKLNKKFGVS